MENDITSQHDWDDNATGEIGALVSRLQQERRTQSLRQASIGVAGLVVLLLVGGLLIPQFVPSEAQYGGITCREVHDAAQSYVDNTLDAPTRSRIDEHLPHCRVCEAFVAELRAQLPIATARTSGSRLMPISQATLIAYDHTPGTP